MFGIVKYRNRSMQHTCSRHAAWDPYRVYGSSCKVQGSGFRVQGPGLRVEGAGLRVEG